MPDVGGEVVVRARRVDEEREVDYATVQSALEGRMEVAAERDEVRSDHRGDGRRRPSQERVQRGVYGSRVRRRLEPLALADPNLGEDADTATLALGGPAARLPQF